MSSILKIGRHWKMGNLRRIFHFIFYSLAPRSLYWSYGVLLQASPKDLFLEYWRRRKPLSAARRPASESNNITCGSRQQRSRSNSGRGKQAGNDRELPFPIVPPVKVRQQPDDGFCANRMWTPPALLLSTRPCSFCVPLHGRPMVDTFITEVS